jgi:hypothetical protein
MRATKWRSIVRSRSGARSMEPRRYDLTLLPAFALEAGFVALAVDWLRQAEDRPIHHSLFASFPYSTYFPLRYHPPCGGVLGSHELDLGGEPIVSGNWVGGLRGSRPPAAAVATGARAERQLYDSKTLGNLSRGAEFPDRKPVLRSGIAKDDRRERPQAEGGRFA